MESETISEQSLEVEVNSVKSEEIEQQSYSPRKLKKLAKYREIAKLRGSEIPPLNYPLTKPKRPRISVLILAILSTIITIGVFVGIAFLTYYMSDFLLGAFNLGKTTGKKYDWDVTGIAQLTGTAATIFFWAIDLAYIALVVSIMVLFIKQTIKLYNYSFISMEEFAVGLDTTFSIVNYSVWGIVPLVFIIYLNSKLQSFPLGKFLIMYVIWFIVFATVVTILLINKIKTRKQFNKLPDEQKDNVRNHIKKFERAKVKRTRKSLITGTTTSSNYDF